MVERIRAGAPTTFVDDLETIAAAIRDRLPAALAGGRLSVDVGATVGLTDAQLRASPVSVTGPLTDAQLRGAAVAISAATLPLPTGAARQVDIEAVRDRLPAALDLDGGLKVHVQQALALDASVLAVRDRLPAALVGGRFSVDVGATVGLTDAQLRASAVPVSGALTDAQLRATAVPVSGPLTDAQLRAATVAVSGPLTDAQLRASAVGVKSEVQADFDTGAGVQNLSLLGLALPGAGGAVIGGTSTAPLRMDPTGTTTQPVSGPLTDAQLRAAAVAISHANLDLALTALRDAIAGAGAAAKTLGDVHTKLAAGLPSVLVTDRLKVDVGATVGLTDAQLRASDVGVAAKPPAAAVVSGQKTVPTAAAETLGAGALVRGLAGVAHDDNTAPVYIGPTAITTLTGQRVAPGQPFRVPVDNVNRVFCISGTANQKISWIGV